MSDNDICFMRKMGMTCEPDECVESCEIYDTVYNKILIRNPNPDKTAWSPMYITVDRRTGEKWPEESMTAQEAMDVIEKRPEDSTCHSVGGKFYAPGEKLVEVPLDDKGEPVFSLAKDVEEPKVEQNPIQDSSEPEVSLIETIWRRGQYIESLRETTSYHIKIILEDTVRKIRKVKEYCEKTDYNTEVYEYHNSDCFYYELNEIHAMSDEIIKNFEKKLDTGIE